MSISYSVSPSDIIKSYNKFQENMLVIDVVKFRESGNKKIKYFDIKLKKEDGKLAPLRIKFFNQEVNNRLKDPKDRDYEQLKISFQSKKNDTFSQAMEYICDSFGKVVKELKNNKIIGDDDEEATKDTIMLENCKPTSPMQKFAKDKEGNRVDFENPLFWFVPAYRRYKDEEEAKLPKLGFNYKAENNKKFLVKDFDISFYDLDVLDTSSGVPKEAILDDSKINNSNIQKFVTKGSLVSGILQMQVIASKQSFSLNTKFASKLYVKTNHDQSAGGNFFDEDDFSIMLKGAGSNILTKKVEGGEVDVSTEDVSTGDAHSDDEDFDDEKVSGMDKIEKLTL
jgi:hypothetical protein